MLEKEKVTKIKNIEIKRSKNGRFLEMSKIKMSFSLILAIFLVGILSTAAFAKDPYGLKPAQVQGTLDLLVNFTGNTAAGDTDATKFALHVYDPSGKEVTGSPYSGLSISSNKGSKIISGLTPSDVYKIQLTHNGDAAVLSTTTGVVTDPHNGTMLNQSNSPKTTEDGGTITLDKDGTGLKNANQTGYNNTRKQRSGDKVHGQYTNNTNSCASCHQTHTAANGEALLFKDGVYSTCSACHDGTTGAYNSFAPATADTPDEISGTFDVKTAGHNGSLHEADGSLQISAAPGGNNNPDTSKGSVGVSTWGQEFDCASCHAAHGGGSTPNVSENNLNLDPMGWAQVAYSTANNDTKNGKLFQNLVINTTVPTTFSTPYIVVKKTLAVGDLSATDKTKYGYLYSRAGLVAGDKVIQTYRWDGSKYVADYSLWLRDVGHVGAPFTNANTAFKAGSTDITNTLNVVWRDGFAYGKGNTNSASALDSVTSAQIAIGVDVETTNDIASLFDSANKDYVVDSGLQMSKYCASCHTDYLSTTRTNETGVYTTAHRHATAQDRLSCVRCHFAHGSEAKIMKDANDETYFTKTAAGMTDAAAISYLLDPNPSSALKRYTGMSVCYACHGQGEQFLGNPNNKERPINGQPGSPRSTDPTYINAPVISKVSIVSSNSDKTTAVNGDTITLTFTANQAVEKLSSFKINGSNPDSFTLINGVYTVTHKVDDGDHAGVVTFQINVKNAAGVYSTTVENTTDNSSVTIQ